MRYCSNCGRQNESDAKFCAGCGTLLEAAPSEEEVKAPETEAAAPETETPAPEAAPAPAWTPVQESPAPAQPYQPYQSQVEPEGISAKGRTFGIIGFILGIAATAFCWLGIIPVGGIVCGIIMIASGIVGLIFCNISKKEGFFKLANIGKVFSIIGICLSGVCFIIGIGVTATYINTVNSYNPNSYYSYNYDYDNDLSDINDLFDNYFNN